MMLSIHMVFFLSFVSLITKTLNYCNKTFIVGLIVLVIYNFKKKIVSICSKFLSKKIVQSKF